MNIRIFYAVVPSRGIAQPLPFAQTIYFYGVSPNTRELLWLVAIRRMPASIAVFPKTLAVSTQSLVHFVALERDTDQNLHNDFNRLAAVGAISKLPNGMTLQAGKTYLVKYRVWQKSPAHSVTHN